MSNQQDLDDLSISELEQILYRKKRANRQERLRRMKAEGRLVVVDGQTSTFEPEEAGLTNGDLALATATAINSEDPASNEIDDEAEGESTLLSRIHWRWIGNRLLLFLEIGAVVGLVVIALLVWTTARELNQEIAEVQEVQNQNVARPMPEATPIIGVVVLPSGHKPPVDGRPPEPGEAGEIPSHLLPIIDAYVPPPIPTPGPEQARRVQIPAITVDKPIVQGDDWEKLKKGVGQHIDSVLPGEDGNLVLSAHNDIYGEIFRELDKLKPGDEVIISTEKRSYTYVVNDIEVVEPTDVWVMGQTDHASATLISCYPYLVNNKRIVVFADLASSDSLAG